MKRPCPTPHAIHYIAKPQKIRIHWSIIAAEVRTSTTEVPKCVTKVRTSVMNVPMFVVKVRTSVAKVPTSVVKARTSVMEVPLFVMEVLTSMTEVLPFVTKVRSLIVKVRRSKAARGRTVVLIVDEMGSSGSVPCFPGKNNFPAAPRFSSAQVATDETLRFPLLI